MATQGSFKKMAAGLFLMLSAVLVVFTLASSAAGRHKNELRSAEDFWKRIVSPDTAKAIAADQQFQRNYLDAVELTADLTRRLADQFALVPELQQASHHIETYRRGLAASTTGLARRSGNPLASAASSFGSLLGIGGGGDADTNSTDSGGGILSGITGGISSALSGVGNSLLQDAGGAAMFLGTGLGAGAAQGLNLAPAPQTMQVAAKVAADNGMNATGLNPAIQNAAMGATASLLGSVNTSSLASGGLGSLDLHALALSLATGIGNGTSAGLQLSPQAMAIEPPAGNTTADIAGTFGFGLTKSLASNINLKSLASSAGSGFDISSLTGGQPLSMIAMSLATGIGNGASSGLKLTQANLAPPTGNTTADALGAFGFGLTDSVTTNINTTQVFNSLKNANVGSSLGNINLAQTASSIGSGLGSGAAAGLKLSSAIVGAPNPNGQDIPNVAGNFAFGLTKSVTENINTSSLASGLTSGGGSGLGGLTSSLDVGRVAQGAAMGLIQGAGDAVNSMGGLQALINGTATMSATPLPANNLKFNDSVGGAATGFGQGLGGQGTLVGVQLLSQVNVTSLLDGLVNGNASSGTKPGGAAAPSNGTAVLRRSPFLPMDVVRRQTEVGAISTGNSFNLSLIFNADTISSVMQRAIDALSCEGVGGIVLVGLGLIQSGTISTDGGNLNSTLIKQVLPKGVMHFTSGGNTFDIDGTIVADNIDNIMNAASGISINGNTVIKFAAFLAVHILMALLTFVTLVPLVLTFDATRNILVRVKMSHVLPNIPRWMNIIWLYVMTPAAILTLLFGSLTAGTSGHFRSAHGVLGLITVIVTLGASATHFLAKQTSPIELRDSLVFPQPFKLLHLLTFRTGINQTLLMLVLPTVIAGFADLSALTICITRVVPLEAAIAFATGLTFLYSVSSALSSVTLYMATRDMRKAKKSADEENWGKKSLKEKINVVKEESAKKGDVGSDREFERD